MCWFGLFIWRPTGWVTPEPDFSMLFIMPAPSTARPVHVWYCFTRTKTFTQRLWLPEPTGNTQRSGECSSFFLYLHKYCSLIWENITHAAFLPLSLLTSDSRHIMTAFLTKQWDRAVSCPETHQQMAPIHNTGLSTSLGFGKSPDINQNSNMLELKQNKASLSRFPCTFKRPGHRINNSDLLCRGLGTSPSLFCFVSLSFFSGRDYDR